MNYPSFYDEIPTITLQDPLSSFLGAFEEGIIEFSYLDVVKSAGHSCPTVLSAYLMTQKGLEALYKERLPQRGEIKVEFKESFHDGVAGVIANVIQHITGATEHHGFKGIAGEFDRRNLMFFNASLNSSVRFTRKDTQQSVDIFYDASSVTPDEAFSDLRQKNFTKTATPKEVRQFRELWQSWVEKISKCDNSIIKITYNNP